MKVKLELDRHGMGRLLLDGHDVSNKVCEIALESKIGEIPRLKITFLTTEMDIEIDGVDVTALRQLSQ